MTVEQNSSLESMETSSSGEVATPDCESSANGSVPAAIRRGLRRCRARWRSILGVALVAAALAGAAGLFLFQFRPDQQSDEAAAHRAIHAASDGAVAVLSYSPGTFDRDFENAKSHLTGEFLDHYTKFAGQLVRPMAQQKLITATADVVRAAVVELHQHSAVVLVFIDQSTASTEKPEPLKTASSVLVTLTKVNGAWLIAKFDPLG